MGNSVTGLSVGNSIVGLSVGTLLGPFVGDLLGLEDVGDDDGVLVGVFVTGLFVGDLVG